MNLQHLAQGCKNTGTLEFVILADKKLVIKYGESSFIPVRVTSVVFSDETNDESGPKTNTNTQE